MRMIKQVENKNKLQLESDEDVIIYASTINKLPTPIDHSYTGVINEEFRLTDTEFEHF